MPQATKHRQLAAIVSSFWGAIPSETKVVCLTLLLAVETEILFTSQQ